MLRKGVPMTIAVDGGAVTVTLDGKPAEPEAMIRQRMARDWGNALGLVKTSLAEDAPAPRSPSLMPRWRNVVDMLAQNGRTQSKSGGRKSI